MVICRPSTSRLLGDSLAMRSSWWRIAVPFLMVVLQPSCSRDGVTQRGFTIPNANDIPQAQREALADQRVTRAEYQLAFESFRACATTAGGRVELTEQEPVSGMIVFSSGADIFDEASPEGTCYAEYFSYVEMVFHRTDPAVLAYLALEDVRLFEELIVPCLEAAGVPVGEPRPAPGTQEYNDLVRLAGELSEDGRCAGSGR